ncbi:hydrogenase/sulfur reductase subunit alpha [Desulfuromonas versatilis]|uniref:Hydrogenase/sulfur reductase subunit alpha n=1 Tax=Desulfuromonas versatilis TaxID=2802975 RepID=A0ABM8I0E0_9BACT|nr:Ni/Fe hydrogenase subunit alpha [Desulfuromonas versatilis]BCR06568.1 hydrogenase/sulfur reductase subunit alpha [Desulfuromonas versatilis]
MRIEVAHLARIEGHANLVVDAVSGELKECRLEIVESPRFFEGLLKGRHYSDVAPIIARICGVCSNSHTLVSLAATERALGIPISRQTRNLRRLLAYGEILQSHILQLYFMAVPDYLGVPSIFPLARSRRDLVSRALRLKKLANDICNVVGGRPVHPVTPCVGGFSALPQASALQGLRRQLVQALPDLEETVELFSSLPVPEFERETEYLSLGGGSDYPIFGDSIVSSDGICAPVAEYAATIEEYLVPHSTAKFARATRESYMVGPLARARNAFARLSPMARQVAAAMGLSASATNPYHSLLARLVEVIHCVEEAIHLIDAVLLAGLREEALRTPEGGGEGAAAIEAPRGTLFHAYGYDEKGCIETADCVIPTAQNLANIEADLRALVPSLLGLPEAELTRRLEMLVRAYDPCISCSTHLLKVEFV